MKSFLLALMLSLPAWSSAGGPTLPRVPHWKEGDTMCYDLVLRRNGEVVRYDHLRYAFLDIDAVGNYTFEYSSLTSVVEASLVIQVPIPPQALNSDDFLLSLLEQRLQGLGASAAFYQYAYQQAIVMAIDPPKGGKLYPIEKINRNLSSTPNQSITVKGGTFNTTKYVYDDLGNDFGLQYLEIWRNYYIPLTGIVKYIKRWDAHAKNRDAANPDHPSKDHYELSLEYNSKLYNGTGPHLISVPQVPLSITERRP